MPTPHQRSRSLRKVVRKAPGGRLVVHFVKKKPKNAHCSTCEKPLGGVPRKFPAQVRNMGKTERRPERMFGGVLCPQCLKRKLIREVRVKNNA